MNGKFSLSRKKLSVAFAIFVAAVLVITVGVLTIALAKQGREKPHDAPNDNIGDIQAPGENDGTQNPDNSGNEDPDLDTGKNEDTETIVPVPSEPIWTSPISEGYVVKKHSTDTLVYSLTLGDYRVHKGIDISAEAGSEVKACLDGTIENVYYDYMMGYCVSISHGDGTVSHYKNLGEELPPETETGREVKSGDVIGYVGESAMVEFSDEPHLHFELEVSGSAANPLEYFEYSETPSEVESE